MTDRTSSGPKGRFATGGGGQGRLHRLYQYGLCLGGFALLGLVVVGVAPTLPRYLHIEKEINTIKESGIRAGAFFYTQVEQIPAMESIVEAALHRQPSKEGTGSVLGKTDR